MPAVVIGPTLMPALDVPTGPPHPSLPLPTPPDAVQDVAPVEVQLNEVDWLV